jgi:syndecan 4/thrombospondin 1
MRSCSSPAPQYGGKDCSGPSFDVQECFIGHCPIHCEWMEFSEWSACSASCDGGISTRMRDFVPAMHGGDDCSGDMKEVRECNSQACPGMQPNQPHPVVLMH